MLHAIADNEEEKEKFEQNTQLRNICGRLFDGIQTDFKKLQKINTWASEVRKRYASKDEFSRNIRQWLLEGDIEELDSLRELASDDGFSALKNKIVGMKDNTDSSILVEKYLDNLKKKVKTLDRLGKQLQNTASGEAITLTHIAEDLPHLHNTKKARDKIETNSIAKDFFGSAYEGVETDIEDIESIHFIDDYLAIPALQNGDDIFLNKDFAKTWKRFRAQLKNLINATNDTTHVVKQIGKLADIHFSAIPDKNSWQNMDMADLKTRLSEALIKHNTLNQLLSFHEALHNSVETIREPLLKIYVQDNLDFETLPKAFEYMIYHAMVREIYKLHSQVLKTKGTRLDQAKDRMKELDLGILDLQRQELCSKLNGAKPLPGEGYGKKSTWTEGALLNHEIEKQKRHVSIRKLMKRAGQSIQRIKPCFLMSPLSVAQYLELGKFKFDLIVIDEASQMFPENALGGIARADQIVVVGDPKQLPPSSLYIKKEKDEEEDLDSEAIMDMALSSFRPSRILSRHYRSQHESLIAFSNYHFYDQSLILFPSPIKNPDELGVKLEYVGGTYKSQSNMDEVKAIVKAALEFMRKYPDRSLGIATMNQPQQSLIEIEMDRAFIEHPHADGYKAKWQGTLQSFFIKNLENVQGDERDAIFISTVYGPDKNGAVMQRFGLINRAGGHRRLNVLFSRAKQNMIVFTSLKPENIKVSGSSSKGVRAFRDFLAYATKGIIDEGQRDPQAEPESDFEIWVKEKLESIGCEVHPQVGVAKYRIDLGVKHPKYPYGYLMGIECDGATYHSSKSARERDVIRQQVLKGLGWRIYRIWSTDWFSDHQRELEKLKNYIQNLLNGDIPHKELETNNVFERDDELDTQDGESDDFFNSTDKPERADTNSAIQIFDTVTYLMLKNDGQEEKRAVQIVPTQGDLNAGTISEHSVIGRTLLGAYKGEEIECTLPIGEVILQVINVNKHKR